MASFTKLLRAQGKIFTGIATSNPVSGVFDCGNIQVLQRLQFARALDAKYNFGKVSDNSDIRRVGMDIADAVRRWDAIGAPTFALGPSASAAFALTDVDAVNVADIELPFETILVMLGDSIVTAEHVDENEHRSSIVLDRILIRKCRPSTPRSIFTALDSGRTTYDRDAAIALFDETVAKHRASGCKCFDRAIGDVAKNINSRHRVCDIAARELSDMEDIVFGKADTINVLGFTITDDGSTTGVQSVLYTDGTANGTVGANNYSTFAGSARSAADALLRIAVNLMLYLDNSGSSEQRFDRSKLERSRAERSDNACVWNVGNEIRLDKSTIAAAKAQANSGYDPTTWKLHSKQTVRGHWKLQPHGEGRKLRKRVFVQPYTRGENLSDQQEKLYTIK